MRVVVTRPEISARRTAEKLAALGHEPVLLPFAVAHHHPDLAGQALAKPHSALAVTSAEAARVLAPLGERLSPYRDDVLYAVGTATAEAIADAGFRNIRQGPGTGAELARMIIADTSASQLPLLYLAGHPRSPKFEGGLQAAGVLFATAEIYRMAPVAHSAENLRNALVEPRASAILFYSRETARTFFEIATPFAKALHDTSLLCLSDNVADIVPQQFHRNIKIAEHPDEESLLALL